MELELLNILEYLEYLENPGTMDFKTLYICTQATFLINILKQNIQWNFVIWT